MAGISVERSSFKPRVRESFIDVPRIRLAVSDRVRNTESVVGKIDEVLKTEKPREDAGVGQWVSYFDTNWRKEGLSADWQNLKTKDERKTIGFSMKGQMEMLQDASDKMAVSEWAKKTKQDLLGFKLEYLSDHLVYPCKYEWNGSRLESKTYGNKDMEETVSAKERNGSVKEALKDMKEFFRTAPDGAIAVMPSPKGDSGLRTDDGKRIEYPDSYFFIMQKKGDTVTNYTLKTDFTPQESREAIYQMTGKRLSPTDSLESYVQAVAKIKPGKDGAAKPSDVVGVLEKIRKDKGEAHAFHNKETGEDIGWSEVYKDIREGEKLYNFNKKTQEAIDAFEGYCRQGNHTKEELQKAISATILRMSKIFYEDEDKQNAMRANKSYRLVSGGSSFGDILGAVADRPGCAGGGAGSGRSLVIDSAGGPMSGTAAEDGGMLSGAYGYDQFGSLVFKCKQGHINTRPRGEFMENCSSCSMSLRC